MPCTGRFTSAASLAGFAPVKADVRPEGWTSEKEGVMTMRL